MRVPLLRSALRLVSRARAGLAAVPRSSAQLSSDLGNLGSGLPRWRWLGRRAGDEMSRAEKMHSTPERAESGTAGMGEMHRMVSLTLTLTLTPTLTPTPTPTLTLSRSLW